VHIAFTKPAYLSRDEVPEADVAAERATVAEISRNEGKPEAALDKIVDGRMNGWFKDRVLLDQSYVKDEKQTIAGMLGSARIVPLRRSSSAPEAHCKGGRAAADRPQDVGRSLGFAASDETIDAATVERMAREMGRAMDGGDLELAVVVGGGNIWRGTTGESGGMDRATSDTMGMLATVINALALQDALEQQGQPTRVLSALSMAEVAEPYIRRRAIRHLEKGRIVIFAAGMGNPFSPPTPRPPCGRPRSRRSSCARAPTPGSTGSTRADPKLDPDGHPLRRDLLHGRDQPDLRVMDLTAITFCKDNNLPILVFDLMIPGNLPVRSAASEIGTLVRDGRRSGCAGHGRHQGQDAQGHRPHPGRDVQRAHRTGLIGSPRAARVDYYGTPTALRQLAGFSVPEAPCSWSSRPTTRGPSATSRRRS
jgi:uridylate kinase